MQNTCAESYLFKDVTLIQCVGPHPPLSTLIIPMTIGVSEMVTVTALPEISLPVCNK